MLLSKHIPMWYKKSIHYHIGIVSIPQPLHSFWTINMKTNYKKSYPSHVRLFRFIPTPPPPFLQPHPSPLWKFHFSSIVFLKPLTCQVLLLLGISHDLSWRIQINYFLELQISCHRSTDLCYLTLYHTKWYHLEPQSYKRKS